MSRLGALNDEFMRRLAPLVERMCPVVPGELFEDYTARAVAALDEDRRAMVAAYVGKVSRELDAEAKAKRQAIKSAWIAAARLKFNPGQRQPCEICGKYRSLTEAHHIVPLGIQFDAGGVEPIQDFRWLCPTHHAAEHVIIAGLINTVSADLDGMPVEERDAMCFDPVAAEKFSSLVARLPRWHDLSPAYRAAAEYMRDPQKWLREHDV